MAKAESHNYDTQKKNISLNFLVKITLLWCPKKLKKKRVLKTRSNALIDRFSWYQNRLLDAQNKLPQTIIRLQEAQHRLPETNIWLINVKSWYYDAQKYWKKMYLRCRHGKITILMFPKNTDNIWFFAKITLLWCPKRLKKTCT